MACSVALLQAWGLGCDGYLSKPIEVRGLAVTLRQVLARDEEERRAVREERIAAVQAAAVA